MNNDLMFSSKKSDWETPQALFDELNKEFHFSLDAAATEKNRKCTRFLGKGFKSDSLTMKWYGNVFLNPPYGAQIKDFVKKAYDEYVDGNVHLVVMLLPARTDTRWFHDYIYQKDFASIRFIKGRLKFEVNGVPCKNAAPFPSMLVIYR